MSHVLERQILKLSHHMSYLPGQLPEKHLYLNNVF
jgi:hypothetical protein